MDKRIKIKSKKTLFQIILLTLFLIIIAGAILYLLYSGNNTNYSTKHHSYEAIGVIIFMIPILLSEAMSKKEYLSDIYIDSENITLIFKTRNKITKTKIIKKDNIQSFVLNADINIEKTSRHARINVKYNFFIDLIKGTDLDISDISDLTLVESNYKFIYRILEASKFIPNFKFNLNSNNEIIKAELDYFMRFGKPIPLFIKLKMEFNSTPLIFKLILLACSVAMLVCIYSTISLNIPPNLSDKEKQYTYFLNNSNNNKEDYNKALKNLDEARKIINTDPYLYYKYARIYKDKKEYTKAFR